MPAVITAADEARLPAPIVPGTQPVTPVGGTLHRQLDQIELTNGGAPEATAAAAAAAGIDSPSALLTPPALHTYSWGSRVHPTRHGIGFPMHTSQSV